MERRDFIKKSGVLLTGTALAGCSGNGSDSGDGGSGQSTEAPSTSTEQQTQQGQDGGGELIELDGDVAQDSHENLKFMNVTFYQTTTPVEASGAGSSGEGGSALGNETTGTATGTTTGTQTQTGTQNSTQSQDDSADIFGSEGAGAGVKGELKNTADEAFSYVEVNVTLYDENDDVLGEWLDNSEEDSISRLESGEVWNFDVVFENADIGQAARYTISADGQLA